MTGNVRGHDQARQSEPETRKKRPLLTFALLAFNQEKYVRQAIDGAFSQTYEPLEIILSDDCSSDDTFKIMQEMAETYKGPHTVIIRQNSENLGVVNHIAEVSKKSKSEYIILAAGDDISKPERTDVISSKVSSSSYDIVSSNVDLIDENNDVLRENTFIPVDYMRKYIKNIDHNFLVAPAAMYRVAFIESALSSIKKSRAKYKLQNEDFLFWLFLSATGGKILRIADKSLVRYRRHDSSISSVNNANSNVKSEKEWLLKERKMTIINYEKQIAAAEMIQSPTIRVTNIDINAIEESLKSAHFTALALSANFSDRTKALIRCRSFFDLRRTFLRLFGLEVAAFLRYNLKLFRRVLHPTFPK